MADRIFCKIFLALATNFFSATYLQSFEQPIIRHIFGDIDLFDKTTRFYVANEIELPFFPINFDLFCYLARTKSKLLMKMCQQLKFAKGIHFVAAIHTRICDRIDFSWCFFLFWNVDIIEMSFARYHTYESIEKTLR